MFGDRKLRTFSECHEWGFSDRRQKIDDRKFRSIQIRNFPESDTEIQSVTKVTLMALDILDGFRNHLQCFSVCEDFLSRTNSVPFLSSLTSCRLCAHLCQAKNCLSLTMTFCICLIYSYLCAHVANETEFCIFHSFLKSCRLFNGPLPSTPEPSKCHEKMLS